MKLHLGCGDHILDGWCNVDVSPPRDLCANLAQAIPVRTETVDFIHSEDFLEHIELEDAKRFLGECFRVLKPGGVMRLLTPDLRAIVERVYLRRDALHLAWCHTFLKTESPCEALNMHMRMEDHAHRFVYDYETLSRILRGIGFRVRRVAYNKSRDPLLRYLDLRNFGLNLFVEATKPTSSPNSLADQRLRGIAAVGGTPHETAGDRPTRCRSTPGEHPSSCVSRFSSSLYPLTSSALSLSRSFLKSLHDSRLAAGLRRRYAGWYVGRTSRPIHFVHRPR